jgi:adenine-specific DNA-methyltransferase
MDITNSYIDLKQHFNNVLNVDKSTFKTSNDEPTPIECVEEMFAKLPTHVWSRDNLRILDPCCGNGNFHLVAHKTLVELGLTSEHILEDVLFFNDVNQTRIQNVQQVFRNDLFSLNITDEDYLTQQYDTLFDIIVANPPYAKLLDNGKRASKNHNLIKEFLEKSLKLLKPNGFLMFITPDNWMSFADRNTVIKKLTAMQIVYLNIHTAKKYFKKIGSSFTWYIIENTPNYTDIVVDGVYKNIHYHSVIPSVVRNYIPLFYNANVYHILAKTVDNPALLKFKVETSSDLHRYTKKDFISNDADDIYKYKLIHTPKQTVYAKRPHKFQDGFKVFISTTDKFKVFIDDCGMTQSIAFIRCDNYDEALLIKTYLEHPLYVFVNNICRWGNFNNIRILQHLPQPHGVYANIYECFGISEVEKHMIETHL